MFVGEEAQGLMSGGANDPFHVVKDELVAKLESIELRVGQFNGLLYGPGTTAGSKPFRDCRKALGREIRGAEGQLKDLGLTVDYVERDRGAFSHIDDRELSERRDFVAAARSRVANARDAVGGPRARAKMDADDKAAVAAQQGDYGASTDLEMANTDFIHGQRARTQATMREQDDNLEQLDGAVDRVHAMASEIHGELQTQSRMINDMESELDETTEKMNFVMGKLSKLLKTKDTCQLWTIVAFTVVLVVMVMLVIWS